jgi:hypothetical protein
MTWELGFHERGKDEAGGGSYISLVELRYGSYDLASMLKDLNHLTLRPSTQGYEKSYAPLRFLASYLSLTRRKGMITFRHQISESTSVGGSPSSEHCFARMLA